MAEAIAQAERINPNDRRLKFYKGALLVLNGEIQPRPNPCWYLIWIPCPTIRATPHSEALELLGRLYENHERFSEAAEKYHESLSLDPHNKAVEEALKRVEKK